MSLSRYYVYVYLREDMYTPYYVGKGTGKRIDDKDRTIPLPPEKRRVVIKDNLLECQAFMLERTLIRFWGRKDNGTGVLRNYTDGGEGSSGYKHTEESLQKISESHKNRTHHHLNTSEAKKNRLESFKKFMQENPDHFKGVSKTEEHKKKISESNRNNPKQNPVHFLVIPPIGDPYEFTGILEFCRHMEWGSGKTSISKCLRGKLKTYRGYKFEYVD